MKKNFSILVDKMTPGSSPKIVSAEVQYLISQGHTSQVLTMMHQKRPNNSYFFEDFLSLVEIQDLSTLFPILKFFDFHLPFFTFLSGYHIISPMLSSLLYPKGKIDAIFAHTWTSWVTAYNLYRRRNIPFVFYHVDPISYIFSKVYKKQLSNKIYSYLFNITKKMDKYLVRNSPLAITTSVMHSNYLKELTGVQLDVLYPGCVPRNQFLQRKNYILAIDRWDPGNTPHFLIDVLSRLKNKPKLIIAGFWQNQELLHSFQSLVNSRKMKNYVSVIGPVDERLLAKLYSEAQVFVHPIEENSISMPALEAAAHGCPIIMPRGTIEPFKHSIHGFFPDSGDVEAYSDYLDQLLDDRKMAKKMGTNAYEVALNNTWTHHGEKVEKMLLRCMSTS